MLQELKQTFNDAKRHYFLLILSSLVDILFFYLLTRLHIETFKQAATHIKTAQKLIESQMAKLSQSQYSQFDKILLGNTDFALQYHEIIKYIGLFLLGFFGIWFLLRGTNWFIAHKIGDSKITIKEFSKRFAFFSIIGFAMFILLLIAYGGMLDYAAFNPLPLINAKTANVIFVIALLMLDYVVSVAFALPMRSKFRDTRICISKAKKIFSVFALSNIAIALLIITPALLMRNYYWFGLLSSLLITIPLITLARTYLINTIKKA